LALVLEEEIKERRTAAEQDGEEQIGKPLAQGFIDEAAGAEGERAPVEMATSSGGRRSRRMLAACSGWEKVPLKRRSCTFLGIEAAHASIPSAVLAIKSS
jgi:hypothetical protein